MWLLAINTGHNGATALYKDSELIFYVEEDRLSRWKYDGNPYLGLEKAYDYTDHVDYLIICGTRNAFGKMPWTGEDPYSCYIRKKQKGIKFETKLYGDDHHLTHAATGFYNSGFSDAAVIVVDGAGSGLDIPEWDEVKDGTWEVESIYSMSYPAEIEAHVKYYGSNMRDSFTLTDNDTLVEVSDSHGLTKTYEAVTGFLGFHAIEAGKTMGIAPYGKFNDSIKLNEGRFTNRSFIKPGFPAGSVIRADMDDELRSILGDTSWHKDETKIDDYRKDLAYMVQKSTEDRVKLLIKKAVDITGSKNIVISGGYGLNCVANYEFLKEFPDLNFYNEPIAHDGGNVIGACQYVYRTISKDSKKTPLTSLYLGPKNEDQYKDIDYEGFTVTDSTTQEVAKLIADENIVCMYQGRSEAGPRALGNRSILFDPTVKNGKDIVNEVKHREWFRPFAGTVLAEKASEWFDLRSKKDTPFMMYAVNVVEDKLDRIPAITHVDGTCRVQTVTKEQNKNYYELIEEFENLKGVPILFNTSFNLGGDPLVETVTEALDTLRRSDLKYLWLPEIGKLAVKD